ncbi:hypothetical protein [Streptomyces sp. HM190]|uniref:hypothetical protein n=1 Tax=Streptomyces sp. HM190 TaxID=2695266 RepID=UPI001F3168D9|nr:hypothetical protein [Streptomyces sp. HM190]
MSSRPGLALRPVIHECDTLQAERFRTVTVDRVVEPAVKLPREAVGLGTRRGEVRPGASDGSVLDAVPAMMTYPSKLCGSERSERETAETIHQLTMPPPRSRDTRPGPAAGPRPPREPGCRTASRAA